MNGEILSHEGFGDFISLQWILPRDTGELLPWTNLLLLRSQSALSVSIAAIMGCINGKQCSTDTWTLTIMLLIK